MTPSRVKEGFHESLLPLYIDIIEDLKDPKHFDEMRSHLIHPDNKELNNIFENFDKREPSQNKKVSKFMSTVEGKIKGTIINKDDMSSGGCNINHI